MIKILLAIGFFIGGTNALLADIEGRIPDEYESAGGHALGLSNAGIAAITGQAAVRLNPAMLPMEKQYRLTTGYHWPSAGREYYQVGIVDSVTSKIGAGVTYTSTQDDYFGNRENPYEPGAKKYDDYNYDRQYDTPIRKRVSLGIGKPFDMVSLGVGVQLVEANDIDDLNQGGSIKGTTLGLGAAGLITPKIRFGLSAENLANKKVKDYAPTTYRAGLAYLIGEGDVTLHLDYRDRERVQLEERSIEPIGLFGLNENQEEGDTNLVSEKMLTASFSARFQNLLRILGAYGTEVNGERSTLSGGIAIVNQHYSLSYLISRPYVNEDRLHQAVNLSLSIQM